MLFSNEKISNSWSNDATIEFILIGNEIDTFWQWLPYVQSLEKWRKMTDILFG